MAADAPKLMSVKRAMLGSQHLQPGRTKHTITDKDGTRAFPPFKSLEIAHNPGSPGYYLFHICADGQVADTWHESLDDALEQAEWEFGVQPQEWTSILEEWG
jgi:hypothetical protein